MVTERDGRWGAPALVPGLGRLSNGKRSSLALVSCGSPSDCAAAGDYGTSDVQFVVTKAGGRWGRAIKLGGLPRAGGNLAALSCSGPGDCSAGGWYNSANGGAFVVSETHGRWGRAAPVPGLAALGRLAAIASLSCASPGNCSAVGGYSVRGSGRQQGFVVSQRHGRWGRAQPVPGLAALNTLGLASVNAVSCGAPGDCSVGGTYNTRSAARAFIASQRRGVWDAARPVRGLPAKETVTGITSLSCPAAGNCSAGGQYAGSAFFVAQRHGVWGAARVISAVQYINSVSCASAGNCSADGGYDQGGCCSGLAFVVTEVHGRWGTTEPVPGLAAVGAQGAWVGPVSCGAAGNCSAGGQYALSIFPPGCCRSYGFIATETRGVWRPAKTFPP